MKKKNIFKILLISVIITLPFLLWATNGDNMIGITPASSAMGGIGVGMRVGWTDSVFRNPAWLAGFRHFHLSFGNVLFFPKVKARYNSTTYGDTGWVESKADTFVVPEVGIVYPLEDGWVMGLGAFGVSGMGVDYRNLDGRLSNMFTNFMLMRSITSFSKVINKHWAAGIGFDLLWGSLDMSATMQDNLGNTWNAGGGQSQDFGLGIQLGLAYRNKRLTGGLFYQSSTKLEYDDLFDTNNDGEFEQMVLEQPEEYAIGIGYKFNPRFAAGIDCRYIDWNSADGYKDFKWESQWVYALGMRYKVNEKLTLRCGYNYADTPLEGKNNLNMTNYKNKVPNFSAPFSDFQIDWFNLMGFPAITTTHYTFGFSYDINKDYGFDLGYIYADNATEISTGTGGAVSVGAQNKQHAFSLALRWKY